MKIKNNLFVVGDSFCRDCFYVKESPNQNKCFWADDLSDKLNTNLICDGEPSRDVQTIIDNWIKILPFIEPEDFLVISIPFFKRTRLPLSEKDYQLFERNEVKYVNRFIGTASYNNIDTEIETFGKQYTWKEFEKNLRTQEIINGSKANQLNQIEIIESLYTLTNGKKFIFSWDHMDFKSHVIEDKGVLTKNIGEWETHRDVYYQSNGKYGLESDIHWSFRMNELFSEYLYKKFTV
jgi:hypothetical protein